MREKQLTYKVVVFERSQVINVFSGTGNDSFRSVPDEIGQQQQGLEGVNL